MNEEEAQTVQLPALPGMEPAALDPHLEDKLRADQARKIFEASEGSLDWMDDYWALRAEGWDWRHAVYIVWASLPTHQRQPPTQQELATQILGLSSDRQIRKWKDKNPAIEVRVRKLQRSALMKARADVMDALVQAASNPSPRASTDRKLYFEMTGDYEETLRIGPTQPDDLQKMTEKEKRDRLRELRQKNAQ
jgi:hypothetical protein